MSGEPVTAAVAINESVKTSNSENHFHLHQHVSHSFNNDDLYDFDQGQCINDTDDDASLDYNDLRKLFETLYGLSSNSKTEKKWLRDRLQTAIHERIATTASKNKQSEQSTLVSCFPAISTSKKSKNNCK